jgi:Cd2+/Zn2+-exporting ATPase
MHLLFSPYLSLVLATVLLNGVKAIFKLKFSSINLLTILLLLLLFGRIPSSCNCNVLGERLEDIGLENSKSALDQLVNRARLLSN